MKMRCAVHLNIWGMIHDHDQFTPKKTTRMEILTETRRRAVFWTRIFFFTFFLSFYLFAVRIDTPAVVRKSINQRKVENFGYTVAKRLD